MATEVTDPVALEQINEIYGKWKQLFEKIGEESVGDTEKFLENCDRSDLMKFNSYPDQMKEEFQMNLKSGLHYKFDPRVQQLFNICEGSRPMIEKINKELTARQMEIRGTECKLQMPKGIVLPVEIEELVLKAMPKRLSYNNLKDLDVEQVVSDILDASFQFEDLPRELVQRKNLTLEDFSNTNHYLILCRRFIIDEVLKHDGEKRIQDRNGKIFSEPLTQIQHYGRGFKAKNLGIEETDLLLGEGSRVTFDNGSIARLLKLQQYNTAPHQVVFTPIINDKPIEISVMHQLHLKEYLGLQPTVIGVGLT